MKKVVKHHLLIILFLLYLFLDTSFIDQKKQSNKSYYKHLLTGTWICEKSPFGPVKIVFDKNGDGYGTTDSMKSFYKFKYVIVNNKILKLITPPYKSEYFIKSLTSTTLSLREYPYKKYRESISAYNADYIRE